MNELIEILLGTETLIAYLATQILGLIGFIAMSIINYISRDNPTTKWNFKYWWRDNWPLLALLIIVMYIGLRWQADIVHGINNSTNELSFIKDKWFWFIIGGFSFRVIIHQINKYVKKITT